MLSRRKNKDKRRWICCKLCSRDSRFQKFPGEQPNLPKNVFTNSESESEFIKSVTSYKITPTIKLTKYNIEIDKSDDTNVKILR